MPKIVEQCRKYPILYLYTLELTVTYAYTLPNGIAHLDTCIPILTHALTILIHWLGFRLSAPYLKTLNRHDSSRQPLRIQHPRTLGSRQPTWIEHPRALASRQPIRIEYYVTRVVSQSESSLMSLKWSRLGLKTFLGFRLESARYSLS